LWSRLGNPSNVVLCFQGGRTAPGKHFLFSRDPGLLENCWVNFSTNFIPGPVFIWLRVDWTFVYYESKVRLMKDEKIKRWGIYTSHLQCYIIRQSNDDVLVQPHKKKSTVRSEMSHRVRSSDLGYGVSR
jgi:hypothetical protein